MVVTVPSRSLESVLHGLRLSSGDIDAKHSEQGQHSPSKRPSVTVNTPSPQSPPISINGPSGGDLSDRSAHGSSSARKQQRRRGSSLSITSASSSSSLRMLRRSHSSVPVFDIRLSQNSGRDQNIVLLKGVPDEAPAATLNGSIQLSAMDSVSVKRVVLRLVATLRLRWPDALHAPKNPAHAPLRYERTVFEREITDLNLPTTTVNRRSNPTSRVATPAASFTNLASYFGHSHSSTNMSMNNHHQGTETMVVPGNYNVPFEFVLPGDIPESIEGHDNAQLAYFLTATVERSRFQHNMHAKKHVRVVRTLGVDTYDWAHTVSIENTWPKKVEYKIFVPSKSVPVGGQLEVHFNMLALDKGLRLGRIRTEIVEYTALTTPVNTAHNDEKVVAQQSFATNDVHSEPDSDGWTFTRVVNLPSSLSRCTQDVTIAPYVKISHKFRVFISLLNRDGHTSELRASLPINLFISPRIYVSSQELQLSSSHGAKQSGNEGPIFDVPHERTDPAVQLESDATKAPPNYSDRVYDRLFSTVASPVESPTASGSQTPYFLSNPGSPGSNPQSLVDMDPAQQAQLQAGLRALAVSQHQDPHAQQSSHSSSMLNIDALSRVPSYDRALHDNAAQDTAPEYQD